MARSSHPCNGNSRQKLLILLKFVPPSSSQQIRPLHQVRHPLWARILEENENYRIAFLKNPRYCTYSYQNENVKKILDWIHHESNVHEPSNTYTCLLNVSDPVATDSCPDHYYVSTIVQQHLAHHHSFWSPFEKSKTTSEKYTINTVNDCLDISSVHIEYFLRPFRIRGLSIVRRERVSACVLWWVVEHLKRARGIKLVYLSRGMVRLCWTGRMLWAPEDWGERGHESRWA
jgi:hypothetical protein